MPGSRGSRHDHGNNRQDHKREDAVANQDENDLKDEHQKSLAKTGFKPFRVDRQGQGCADDKITQTGQEPSQRRGQSAAKGQTQDDQEMHYHEHKPDAELNFAGLAECQVELAANQAGELEESGRDQRPDQPGNDPHNKPNNDRCCRELGNRGALGSLASRRVPGRCALRKASRRFPSGSRIRGIGRVTGRRRRHPWGNGRLRGVLPNRRCFRCRVSRIARGGGERGRSGRGRTL